MIAREPVRWRNSLEAAEERLLRRIAPPKPALNGRESPDLKHCLAVLRAHGGCGFPHAGGPR